MANIDTITKKEDIDNKHNDNENKNETVITKIKPIEKDTYCIIPSNLDPSDDDVISILVISDTHGMHNQLQNMPSADILIHCGDFTNVGELQNIKSYQEWTSTLKLKHKKYKHSILIAGNHDCTLDKQHFFNGGCRRLFQSQYNFNETIDANALTYVINQATHLMKTGNNIYLLDSAVTLYGLKFFGTPWQPEFCQWAFNVPTDDNGKLLKEKWSLIPNDIDILISHGPPYMHGDQVNKRHNFGGDPHVGDKYLMDKIKEIKPYFHLFGHIHSGYGVTKQNDLDTIFVNASNCDTYYKVVNKPIMFYIKKKEAMQQTEESKNDK